MSAAPDRIPVLLSQSLVTGIDFIYVYPDQRRLDVYFLRPVTTLDVPLPGSLTADDILIYSEETTLPIIEIETLIGFTTINNQDVLQLKTKAVGDFTLYKLFINDRNSPKRIDPYFNDISFSFKANCPSDLDCAPPAHECPPDALVDFPIDYLARDFWSYRKALLDFASLRYPDWTDRLEADSGIMMAELMSALGDEMAYYQDRIAREAYLETATQRRSIRKHARLVDYQMHDGLGAKTWIDVNVITGIVAIPAGTSVFALGNDNTKIDFEIGEGLYDESSYSVNAASNEFFPHIWDEDDTCLPVGTTQMHLVGHQAAVLSKFKWVLIKTSPTNAAQTPRAQMVKLVEITDTHDPTFNIDITKIVWEQAQALAFEFDLTILTVRGNMVLATAGKTNKAVFIVDKNGSPVLPADGTVNRIGHDNSNTHYFTLPNLENQQLVFLGENPHEFNQPEILLEEIKWTAGTDPWDPTIISENWDYKSTLVGVVSSNPLAKDYTLDDGTWQRIVAYQRIGQTIEHKDYAFNAGVTIRFGDGEFGKIPAPNTAFRVKYRLGGTRRSNVAADTITSIELAGGLTVTNPLPAKGGFDPETPIEVRQLAPEAFRSLTYRAVRPEDYAEAAERLPWVQKAGSEFRWTGSWLTSFTTPDPKGKVILENTERLQLTDQLNRFRQAGREINVLDPIYANIDLKIEVCVADYAYAGEVKERVLEVLMGKKGIRSTEGYFSPDRFTFGTFLERSTLEAAIQNVPGVKAVEKINFRRRAWFGWRVFTELSYDPGMNAIIRIANDSLHPQRGTINIYTHGGL